MRFLLAGVAAVGIGLSSPVSAAWHVAETKHFVIYSDDNPTELAKFAEKLERFDQAGRYLRAMDDPPVGSGNRLTVFVLPNEQAIQKLAGSDFVKGFYKGRASGSVAFVPRRTDAYNRFALSTDNIFFHEYAHHLMFQAIDRPLPEWIVEGFAEFMSTVRFERNGSVGIGAPAIHRAPGLFRGQALPIETLLSGNYGKLSPELRESVYGKGWLLIHYLTFDPARKGQIDRYADLIATGVPSLDAAKTAFGDLKQLDRDLNGYLNKRNISYLQLAPSRFREVDVAVRPLSQGAATVMPLRILSQRTPMPNARASLAAQVRAVQAKYPGDELVELTLCQAELDADQADAAGAAADRAMKANPKNAKALICKGRATAEQARKMSGPARKETFARARSQFVAANKIDTEDPEALANFFRTYLMEGVRPTPNAVEALHYAATLAPQDLGLRMNSAMAYLAEKKIKEARAALTPIAYDPHSRAVSQIAKTMIERIDAGDARGAMATRPAATATDPE